jgi:acetoin utilization protein AcuB
MDPTEGSYPMLNRIPNIKSVMTPFPYSVSINSLISDAREYMREHGIHHLPIIDGDTIAGLVDEKDIAGDQNLTINKISFQTPHLFDLNERMDIVLGFMADNYIDTVLLTRNNKLVGIFTVTDACRHFAEYLREEFGPHDGNDAA